MTMVKFRISLTGTAPLLMHNSQLSDPLDPRLSELRRINKKSAKTQAEHLTVAKLEYVYGLYFAEGVGPYVPSANIHSMLVEAGRKSKQGIAVRQAILFEEDINQLSYVGPTYKTPEEFWEDKNFQLAASVRLRGAKRITRYRPMFRQWSVDAIGLLDDEQLNLSDVQNIAEVGGTVIGLGDWRPNYGRFVAVAEKVGKA